MLMHAALPGTQHLNDSKSASAPLWGWDTAPCSTSSHHSPWTLNVPHWLSEMTLAQNRGRGPQRAAAFWVLEILGNSCCGSRQTSAGVPAPRSPARPGAAVPPRTPGALPCPGQPCQGQSSCSLGHRGCSGPAQQGTGPVWPCRGPGEPPGTRHRCQTRGPAELTAPPAGTGDPGKEAKKTFP